MTDPRYTIIPGDCVESMRSMVDRSVHCCITSPPYWALRDYGNDGQIGLESSPDQYVAAMVAVFAEVRRVLRDDGTLWLNLGDSYAGGVIGMTGTAKQASNTGATMATGISKAGSGLKPKNLIGIPWRVALALQADGWILRSDIIWHKPNPMPESVTDRPTKAHEYLFLLSKRARYYYDSDAISEPHGSNWLAKRKPYRIKGNNDRNDGGQPPQSARDRRNKRSVWTIPTRPYGGAHFATFPVKLIEPCALAGCPVGGLILDPFGGSGTTAIVALNNQRRAVLCELSADYIAIAHERIGNATRQRSIFDLL